MGNFIKTREIGERFRMDGVLYEVAEDPDVDDPCEGCSLQNEKAWFAGVMRVLRGFVMVE